MMRVVLVSVAVGLLAGCLSSGQPSAFGIISISPSDGARGVAPDDVVSVELSQAVAEETLETIELRGQGGSGFPVAVDVGFESATNTLTIDPVLPLLVDDSYRLDLSGLTSLSAQTLTSPPVTFFTLVNPVTSQVVFDSSGSPIRQVTYENDSLGRLTLVETVDDPGPDGEYGTGDDVIFRRLVVEYIEDGLGQRRASYTGPGTDGSWGTADDVIGFYTDATTDPVTGDRQTVRYDDMGPDGTPFTSDDVISAYEVRHRLSNGEESIQYGGPGDDGDWLTSDDEISSMQRDTFEDLSEVIRYSSAPGADGEYGTPDDPGTLSVHDLTEHGILVEERSYDAGPDGELGTEDDVVTSSTLYILGEREQWLTHASFDGNGTQVFRQARSYREDLSPVRETSFNGAGLDGNWGTSDDALLSYRSWELDEAGARQSETLTTSSGPDGVWQTEDDIPLYTRVFDTTK